MNKDLLNTIKKKYYNNLLHLAEKKKDNNFIYYLNNILKSDEYNDVTSDILYSEDYIYKKNWNKLNNIHKMIKIKEYINNNLNLSNNEKNTLVDQFEELIKSKKLKKNDIFYDVNNAKILSIDILNLKN
uniref:Uncharacterized protein n=1 Tax=Megaviridae environmental sample TaxID=1737588 RepID=A0A5J6VKR8_9VIRU|nr:MAG: hypothetical protein [Megaviridae environmental sample]